MMKTINMKKNIFTTGVALVASLTMATGAFADTQSNNVDITVQAGEFSLTTSNIDSFGDITLEAAPQTYQTSFASNFTVKDLRGSQAGWRLDVSASPFDDGDHQLPSGSLSLEPISNIERVGTGSGALPTESMTSNEIIDNGTVEIAKAVAGSGMGVFDITFPSNALSLVVDATTAKAGTYTSTLTWNLVNAP